ncbi:MAG TPA: hypothetical protein VFS67_04535 [Polyangiaceae bacterium]|nr:hypothetical protein [Polyangiaceae bacterium]
MSARMGLLGPQLSPHIDGPQFGFHGFNMSLETPIASHFRMGIELELVGLADDLALEHADALSGAAVSGVLTGLAAQGSLGVLQLHRFDLDAQLLLGLVSAGVGNTNFKVTAAAPALPDASYHAGAVGRVAARLAGYFWLSGFEYQRRSNAIGLFASLGLDSHWLWVDASGKQPVSALHNELAMQLGVALSGAP